MRIRALGFVLAALLCVASLASAQVMPLGQHPGSGGTSGSGTTGYLPVWTGTTALGNSLLYQDTGNSAIATSLLGEGTPQDLWNNVGFQNAFNIGGLLTVVGDPDSQDANIRLRGFRGTYAAPTTLLAGDVVGRLAFDAITGIGAFNAVGTLLVTLTTGPSSGGAAISLTAPGQDSTFTFGVNGGAPMLYLDGPTQNIIANSDTGVVSADVSSFISSAYGGGPTQAFVIPLDNGDAKLVLPSVGDVTPKLDFVRGRGTFGTPTMHLANDVLGRIRFQGFTGSLVQSGPEIIATALSDGDQSGGFKLSLSTGADNSRLELMHGSGTPGIYLLSNPSKRIVITPAEAIDVDDVPGLLSSSNDQVVFALDNGGSVMILENDDGATLDLRKFHGTYASPAKVTATSTLGKVVWRGYTGTDDQFATGPAVSVVALTDLDDVTPDFRLDLLGVSIRDTIRVGTQSATPELVITNALVTVPTLNATVAYQANGTPGKTQAYVVCTGVACATSCTLTFTQGILTANSGTCP
jgi:hypothetical protein